MDGPHLYLEISTSTKLEQTIKLGKFKTSITLKKE